MMNNMKKKYTTPAIKYKAIRNACRICDATLGGNTGYGGGGIIGGGDLTDDDD